MSEQHGRSGRRPELSQHFLRSPALAASLVASAPVGPLDLVVEIGPGHGLLTHALARRCREVRGVELDGALCRELALRFRDEPRVSITQADFLHYPLPKTTAYKVVGNIPFNRTAAIVERVTRATPPPEDVYLVVQTEAARRFAGMPFAPESLVSLGLKPWWQIEIARRLARADFEPRPRVDSVVLWMARRPRPLVTDEERRAYHDFIGSSFGRTGNTVGRCLRGSFTREQVRQLARDLRFDLEVPPSRLSFDQWLGLFRFLILLRGATG
ncbi:MAG: 23S ribosomal RNA methyltransferase Erm [Gemmatimonadales bacterium]